MSDSEDEFRLPSKSPKGERPYTNFAHAAGAAAHLITRLGEDTGRDGLRDTPRRMVNALLDLTSGYTVHVGDLLSCTFEVGHYDQMIVVRRVPFWSLCEHHVLPFHGHATVGYIPKPGTPVVGLSKLARLVDAYARRLQIQERMTKEIGVALMDNLCPAGVGVVVEAVHACMASRGAGVEAPMVTSYLRGSMRDDASVRSEFFALARE